MFSVLKCEIKLLLIHFFSSVLQELIGKKSQPNEFVKAQDNSSVNIFLFVLRGRTLKKNYRKH